MEAAARALTRFPPPRPSSPSPLPDPGPAARQAVRGRQGAALRQPHDHDRPGAGSEGARGRCGGPCAAPAWGRLACRCPPILVGDAPPHLTRRPAPPLPAARSAPPPLQPGPRRQPHQGPDHELPPHLLPQPAQDPGLPGGVHHAHHQGRGWGGEGKAAGPEGRPRAARGTARGATRCSRHGSPLTTRIRPSTHPPTPPHPSSHPHPPRRPRRASRCWRSTRCPSTRRGARASCPLPAGTSSTTRWGGALGGVLGGAEGCGRVWREVRHCGFAPASAEKRQKQVPSPAADAAAAAPAASAQGLGTSSAAEAKEYFAGLDSHRKQFVWEGAARGGGGGGRARAL
jgi:hypothetical protein